MADISDRLQAILDDYVAQGIIGVTFALHLQGEPEIRLCAGVTDMATGAPMTPGNLVKAGSCAKTFTAAAILQLVAEGHFELDDSIEPWFPALDHAGLITVRMLLNHRNGLPEYEDVIDARDDRFWTPDQIVDFALKTGRQTSPGDFAYNNLGYILAGIIIEKETGESYSRQMRKRFFDPLRLENSWSASGEAFPLDRLARCYMHNGEPPAESTSMFPFSAAWAAGDLVSTPSDLVRWLDALFNGRVLEKSLLHEMTRNIKPASFPGSRISHNGAGILVSTFDDGLVVKGHLGQLRGFITMMARHEPNGISAALSQNSSAQDVTDPHCAGIHEVFAALLRAAGAQPSAQEDLDAC